MPLNDLELVDTSHAAEAQIERILRSDTFRNTEALRKLLRFLADRLAAGDADQLKEYSVGIDGLGKPPDYDPRIRPYGFKWEDCATSWPSSIARKA